MEKYTYNKVTATTYRIRGEHFLWANITVRPFKNKKYFGVEINIKSDYGDYQYTWGSMGSDYVDFLSNVDYSYFMGKMRSNRGGGYRFSSERSEKLIREKIKRYRREGNITAPKAREFWDALEYVEFNSKEGFFYTLMETRELFEELYGSDPIAIDTADEYDPQCRGFWENIWPIFLDILKNEKDSGKIAASNVVITGTEG